MLNSSQSQNLSKAKADPKLKLIQIQAKAMGMVIIGIDMVVGLPLVVFINVVKTCEPQQTKMAVFYLIKLQNEICYI